MTFLSFLISGISLGSIYAIIALGYTMVYGIAKMLNFAHGDVIMVGAYICFYATTRFELPAIVGVILAIIVCTVLGIVIERLAYKPLRAAPILAVLITAIGVSYFLQNAALLLWSSNPKVFTSVIPKGNISLFGGQLTIPYVTLVTIVVCIIIMIALVWFTSKTKMGKAMRACSEDKGAAQLMGINVNGTISLTFAIGSGLAAIAGVLLCSAYPTLVPTTGSMPGIKAFTAAVFGGIGSIPGALLGGVLLGIIEIFAKAYISTQLSDAIVFAVLIVVLLTALLVVGIRFAGKTYTESMRLSEAQELCSTLTSVISDKLRFCGTVTQDENGGLTQIFIQNVGSVEGKGDAFQIGEDGQLALGDRHLLGSASYPKGLQVTAFTLRYDASTGIFSVTLEIGDRSRQTLSQTSFEVKRINRTVT